MDVSDDTPIEPGRSEPVEDARDGDRSGVLEQIWAAGHGDLDDEQALAVAVAEQHAQRRG